MLRLQTFLYAYRPSLLFSVLHFVLEHQPADLEYIISTTYQKEALNKFHPAHVMNLLPASYH